MAKTGGEKTGPEKKAGSVGSYKDLMTQLDKQANKKSVSIEVDGETYTINNPYGDSAYELSDNLANQLYDGIRKSDTDVSDIAKNLGFKAENVNKIKEHVFHKKHKQDRYGPENMEYKRFDPSLSQALAWKRLENGTHTPEDVTWMKHEYAESHHEVKHDSGYSEAHDRAQSRFDGAPWDDNW